MLEKQTAQAASGELSSCPLVWTKLCFLNTSKSAKILNFLIFFLAFDFLFTEGNLLEIHLQSTRNIA